MRILNFLRFIAEIRGLRYVALEDGFLRSFGTGQHFPQLSMVMDDTGIYYDCTKPSSLEQFLASDVDVLKPHVRKAVMRKRVRNFADGAKQI